MGSTFQPPIHIDPNQDGPQQVSFINQNFQSLASALETNSFRIASPVQTTTIVVPNPPVAGTQYLSPVIQHNLGFVPAFIAFANPPNVVTAGANAEIPWLSMANVTISTIPLMYVYFIVDSHNLTNNIIQFYARSSAADANYSGTWTIQYYLLQLLAAPG